MISLSILDTRRDNRKESLEEERGARASLTHPSSHVIRLIRILNACDTKSFLLMWSASSCAPALFYFAHHEWRWHEITLHLTRCPHGEIKPKADHNDHVAPSTHHLSHFQGMKPFILGKSIHQFVSRSLSLSPFLTLEPLVSDESSFLFLFFLGVLLDYSYSISYLFFMPFFTILKKSEARDDSNLYFMHQQSVLRVSLSSLSKFWNANRQK